MQLNSCNSAYRLRYWNVHKWCTAYNKSSKLQQCLPLAVLKLNMPFYRMKNSEVLQQCLPLAVLKPESRPWRNGTFIVVATVLTACGIETTYKQFFHLLLQVATVLTACGIETSAYCAKLKFITCRCNSAYRLRYWNLKSLKTKLQKILLVATVLTACGIETVLLLLQNLCFCNKLQQCLPLAVLKLLGI